MMDPIASQWNRACSSGGTYWFPYGPYYVGTTCNTRDYWGASPVTTLEVAFLTGCQSSVTGYTSIYDLSGNVVEWEDACDGSGPSANCQIRGGSFDDDNNATFPSCGYYLHAGVRNLVRAATGFRCCAP
jgi:formylglycine-generating enzyme